MSISEQTKVIQAVVHSHVPLSASPSMSDVTFRLLFQNSSDAIVITDDDGRFLEVNPAACVLFGCTHEEMLLMGVADFLTPSEPTASDQHFRSFAFGQETGEFSFVRSDGQELSVAYSTCGLEAGKYASILHDISARKATEQRLRENAQHFHAFMNHSPLSAWIVDAEGRFRFVNPGYYKMFGVAEDLTEKTIAEVYPEALTEEYERNNRIVLEDKRVIETIEAGLRPDGTQGQFYVVKFPIETPSGEVLLGGKALDITERKQAEVELHERVEEIETLLETIPAAVWIATDPECKRIIGNRASYEFVRMPPKSNISKSAPPEEYPTTYRTLMHGREIEPHEHPMQRAAAEGREILGVEETLVFEDGTQRDIYGNASPLFDAEGKVRGVIAAFVDITERKQMERRLRANQEWLTLAFNTVRMVIWSWDFVANQIETTPNFSDIYGCPAVVMAEQGMALVHPDDRARHEATVRNATQTGRYYSSFRVVRPDNGEIVWVEEQGTVFPDETGRPHKMLGIALDVTAREKLAHAKRESESQFRRLFEANVLGILITDLSGTIRQANDAFLNLIGYRREELESGQISWVDLTPPELLYLDEEGLRQLRAHGSFVPYEKVYRHKDGRRIPVLVGAATLESDSETAIAYVLDLSRQKAHEQEIEDLNTRLRRAMTETHHRVKNNLQVISALVDMQIGAGLDTIASSELVRLSQHISGLAVIHDLLTHQTKKGGESDKLSVQETLDKLFPLLQGITLGRKLKVEVEDVLLPIRQATSLAVLANELVSNATKHGRGDISIAFSVTENQGLFEVWDQGLGFPPDFNPRVSANTGVDLVEGLSRHDLQGEVSYGNRPEGGASIVVRFPLQDRSE